MTLLVLAAIFCVLVVIARELRLLRKQREGTRTSPEPQQAQDEYKPRIFTFGRSGWSLRLVDLDEWIGIVAAVVIWWKFILPRLPAQPLIKYPITIVALLVGGFLAVMVVEVLDPLHGWMERYDERVYNRVFSPEEREHMEDPYADSSEIEEMYRQKGL